MGRRRRRRAKQRKKNKFKSKLLPSQRECKVRFYSSRRGPRGPFAGKCKSIASMIRRRRITSKGSMRRRRTQTSRRRTCSCLKRRRSRTGRCRSGTCIECSRCEDRTCSHRGAIQPAARNPNCTTPRVNGGSSQMLGEDSSTPTPDFLAGYQAAKGATVRPTTPRRVNQVQKAGCVCNPAKCDDPNCDGVTPNGAGKILPRLLCKKICPSPRCDGAGTKRCDLVQEEGRCIADSAFGKQWSSLMDITYPHYKQKMEWKQSEVFGQQVIHALVMPYECGSKYKGGLFSMAGVHRLLNSKDKPIGKVIWKAGIDIIDLDGLSVVTMFKRIVCFGTECYTFKIGQCYTCSDTRRGYAYFADQGRFGNTNGYEIQTLLECPNEKLMLCADSGSVSTQVPRLRRHMFKTLSGKEVVKWRLFQFSGLIGAF